MTTSWRMDKLWYIHRMEYYSTIKVILILKHPCNNMDEPEKNE